MRERKRERERDGYYSSPDTFKDGIVKVQVDKQLLPVSRIQDTENGLFCFLLLVNESTPMYSTECLHG